MAKKQAGKATCPRIPTEISTVDLPRGLSEIAEWIGIAGALTLAEAWGGIRYYYPRPEHLSDDHPLVIMLGREDARTLCTYIGGGDMIVPRAVAPLRAARDRAIRAAHRHCSARDLARRYHLSERRVWEILATRDRSSPHNHLEHGEQLRLF